MGPAHRNVARPARNYEALAKRCVAFDEQSSPTPPESASQVRPIVRAGLPAMRLRLRSGGRWQQTTALLTKENTSNGDIGTWMSSSHGPAVDFAQPNPRQSHARSHPQLRFTWHWNSPMPSRLGTYPIARGTDDGGEGMPVEEAATCSFSATRSRKRRATRISSAVVAQLTEWAQYLEQYGLDPENQLCTDDFMAISRTTPIFPSRPF